MYTTRLAVLDGWRGTSILLVLAAHLLPLGPKAWLLNDAIGIMGMSVFFFLSGYLIAGYFYQSSDVKAFLVRRISRILPLAWAGLLVAYFVYSIEARDILFNALFIANWPPMHLRDVIAHYWSLCIEMQYYFGIALAFVLLKKRLYLFIFAVGLAVTVYRVANGEYAAVLTYYRLDEIMSGSMVAVLMNDERWREKFRRVVSHIHPVFPMALWFLSSHEFSGWLNYGRAYFVALMISSTICRADLGSLKFLLSQFLAYIAKISYALYVIHPFLDFGWLGEGDGWVKYLKRPILFLALFVLAHFSTNYFEKWFTDRAKRYRSEFAA